MIEHRGCGKTILSYIREQMSQPHYVFIHSDNTPIQQIGEQQIPLNTNRITLGSRVTITDTSGMVTLVDGEFHNHKRPGEIWKVIALHCKLPTSHAIIIKGDKYKAVTQNDCILRNETYRSTIAFSTLEYLTLC